MKYRGILLETSAEQLFGSKENADTVLKCWLENGLGDHKDTRNDAGKRTEVFIPPRHIIKETLPNGEIKWKIRAPQWAESELMKILEDLGI